MKYYAEVNSNEYEIEINDKQILVNGEAIEIDLQRGGVPELYSTLFNGHSYEVLIESDRSDYAVTLRGEQFQVHVEDERTRRLNTGRKAPALAQGTLVVHAPIPGLVVKVLVEVGEAVAEDQPMVILEAMKMENEIRTQRAGTIKKVEIEAGQRVEQGAALITLE